MYYYFKEDKLDDVDIQVELELSRVYYYRMKKAAITLFGVLLWNIVVEECIAEKVTEIPFLVPQDRE